MKTKATMMIWAGVAALVVAYGQESKAPADGKERTGYTLGVYFASQFPTGAVDLDYEWLARGFKDKQSGAPLLLTQQELHDTLARFSQDLAAKRLEREREVAEKNRKDGDAFLAANKARPGIVTLPSGLQYKVIAEGEGHPPTSADRVSVNYRGLLIDGTEFDSSAKSGAPAVFQMNHVIPGWTDALTRMKPGAKWRLFVPSDLAYGPTGHPPRIGPNAVLLFDLELVSIQPPQESTPATPPGTVLTSDIIKVPSIQEIEKGAKIETIKAEDLEKLQKQQQEQPGKK